MDLELNPDPELTPPQSAEERDGTGFGAGVDPPRVDPKLR